MRWVLKGMKNFSNRKITQILPIRPAYGLRKRDPSNGSFVFVINMGKFDFEKYGLNSAFNALYNSVQALFEDEENQILGIFKNQTENLKIKFKI